MRILYVSQYFPPEIGAPAARVSELARAWMNAGHSVGVLTGFPNHPTGRIPAHYRGRVLAREVAEGIQVIRTWLYATPNRGVVRRSLSYVSFAGSAGVLGQWFVPRTDVVVATSPQFLVAVAGWAIARIRRVPFVFEIRDLWPESVVAVGALRADSIPVRALTVMEEWLYREADRIVVVTRSFRERLVARGVPPKKIDVVPNGVDLDRFDPNRNAERARSKLGIDADAVLVSYVGTHGMAHALDRVLDVAMRCRQENMVFLFVGEGAQKRQLVARAKAEGLENVRFLPGQPRDAVVDIYAASDVCLVPLKRAELFTTVIPSKIFEILAMARPIVLAVDGEARELVERSGGGICVKPEDVEAMTAALRKLANDRALRTVLGRRGREFVEQHYDRRQLAARYLRILGSVVRRVAASG